MFRKQTIVLLAAALASIATPAFSQDEWLTHRSSAMVQGFGSFVKTTTDQGIRQSATDSGGVLASYDFFFTKHSGVEADYGYSENTQHYGLTTGRVDVKSRSHEITGAYVYRFPTRTVTPFVLAGAGALIFDPKDNPTIDRQGRFAFVYGAGAEFTVSSRIFVRAQFRGLIYKTPVWDIQSLAEMGRWSHRAEPSAGVGFRF